MKMKTVHITIQELSENGVHITLEEICNLMEKNNTSFERTISDLYSDNCLEIQ